MKIKKILSAIAVALFAAGLSGCYEKFTEPGEQKRYDDQYFTEQGFTVVPISTVMALFENPANKLVNHIENNTVNGASPTNTATYGRYYQIAENYVIRGKVTSNDAFGNFYRSLFIQDESGGVEVKVGVNGMITKYPIGQTVYIVCRDLALGNYRSMLSLGIRPLPEDKSDNGDPYANRYMDVQTIVNRHVFLGPATELTEADITVIADGQSLTDSQFTALGGRLVRLEGLVSKWVDAPGANGGYPSFLHKHSFNNYAVYSFKEAMDAWRAYREAGSIPGQQPAMPEPQNNYFDDPQPSWGFQEHQGDNTRNFGSALFTKAGYTGSAEILVRTSGYTRFALKPVTPDKGKVNVTAIVSRYTSRSGGNLAFQLTVNNVSDIVDILPNP